MLNPIDDLLLLIGSDDGFFGDESESKKSSKDNKVSEKSEHAGPYGISKSIRESAKYFGLWF